MKNRHLAQLVRAQSDTKKDDTLIPCDGEKQKFKLFPLCVGSSPSMPIFLPSLYPFIRVLVFMALFGCGSVNSINGVRIPKERPNYKAYVLVIGCSFVFGYYMGSEVLPQNTTR